ncbi:MAG: cation:dicarboxylase symporter family transporter [Roseomonas sp.]|nr:cation:dicarboxylase symporter family transporter [Roseomonas sp.]MCA3428332.1 cation:dicarboxylase symporter family transporter [Roseomonas sp.]MCA3432712.1 cation:dicarboxylase symporter family transporter [Roseomonas sp.]
MNSTGLFSEISKKINRPSVTIVSVIIAVWLGYMQFPFVEHLQPIGSVFIALLQVCVLPFLMATIPLAVRSAFMSEVVGRVVGRLLGWLLVTTGLVILVALLVPLALFHLSPMDNEIARRIGAIFGGAGGHVDLEFALSPQLANEHLATGGSGLLAIVPSNIFASLSSNNSLQVMVFLFLFGLAMVHSERRSGTSIFNALRHIQSVCLLIFEWFNLFMPIGIIALVAPQIALLGNDAFVVLAPFAIAFLVTSLVLLTIPIFVMAMALRVSPRRVFGAFAQPLALACATRNTLVCAPTALETMIKDLNASRPPCELFIPIAFAVVRFGNIVHFIIAALFIANLTGHDFSFSELLLVALFSLIASFATIGVSGVAGLVPLAAVLRPFGLSYELALPLMIVVDPIVSMLRAMLNVALSCQIPALASLGSKKSAAAPAE